MYPSLIPSAITTAKQRSSRGRPFLDLMWCVEGSMWFQLIAALPRPGRRQILFQFNQFGSSSTTQSYLYGWKTFGYYTVRDSRSDDSGHQGRRTVIIIRINCPNFFSRLCCLFHPNPCLMHSILGISQERESSCKIESKGRNRSSSSGV